MFILFYVLCNIINYIISNLSITLFPIYQLHYFQLIHTSSSKRRPPVLAHTLKDPWPALNYFPCCYNSSYQILFYVHTGLINEIHEVTTKEEILVKISAFRRHLDRLYSVSDCPMDAQTVPLQRVLI